jgi:hypothetical protein
MKRVICVAAAVAAVASFPGSASAEVTAITSGSGWIIGNAGGQATFDASAQLLPDGTVNGNLLVVDHSLDLRVKSTSITTFTPGCTSTISGEGDSSAGPVNFAVTVQDNDEPGTGVDTFSIQVIGSVAYANAGILQGGNVEAHFPVDPCL